MALDLTELKRVAESGEPRDAIPVSRRWLAQVWSELNAARSSVAVLDHEPYTPPLSAA